MYFLYIVSKYLVTIVHLIVYSITVKALSNNQLRPTQVEPKMPMLKSKERIRFGYYIYWIDQTIQPFTVMFSNNSEINDYCFRLPLLDR